MCIQTGKTMSDPPRMKFATDQFYFKTAEEMAKVFGELPDAVTRTMAIAERCNVKIQRVSNPFPEFKVPDGQDTGHLFRARSPPEFCVARGSSDSSASKVSCATRLRITNSAFPTKSE